MFQHWVISMDMNNKHKNNVKELHFQPIYLFYSMGFFDINLFGAQWRNGPWYTKTVSWHHMYSLFVLRARSVIYKKNRKSIIAVLEFSVHLVEHASRSFHWGF